MAPHLTQPTGVTEPDSNSAPASTPERREVTPLALFDQWRKFPAYQLERRADIFFALYLPEVLEEQMGVPMSPCLIPEFPLKHAHNNQSDKLDYLAFSKDLSRAFLVELKTSMSSRNATQDRYLQRAKLQGLKHLVRDVAVLTSAANKSARAKYLALLECLEGLKLLTLPRTLSSCIRADVSTGVDELLRQIEYSDIEARLEIVYVQPKARSGELCIDFEQFATVVERHKTDFSQRFAQSLRGWISQV